MIQVTTGEVFTVYAVVAVIAFGVAAIMLKRAS
jgi:type IV secretory pathway VirB2 component (pilin)